MHRHDPVLPCIGRLCPRSTLHTTSSWTAYKRRGIGVDKKLNHRRLRVCSENGFLPKKPREAPEGSLAFAQYPRERRERDELVPLSCETLNAKKKSGDYFVQVCKIDLLRVSEEHATSYCCCSVT